MNICVLLEVDVLSWLSLQVDLSGLSHVQRDSVVSSVLPNEQHRGGQDALVPSDVGGRLAACSSEVLLLGGCAATTVAKFDVDDLHEVVALGHWLQAKDWSRLNLLFWWNCMFC